MGRSIIITLLLLLPFRWKTYVARVLWPELYTVGLGCVPRQAVISETGISRRSKVISPFTGKDDFVFCKRDGTPLDPNYLRKKVLYPALDLAGIERKPRAHGFHMFRHSAGSNGHAKTGDLKLAQELLEHARISTTSDIYIHVPEKVAELATEIIASELSCAQIVPKTKESIN